MSETIPDKRAEGRATTDESLREERATTDELLDARRDEQQVGEVVRERRTEAEKILREVRADSDEQLDKHLDTLPKMSEKLEDVAESLSKAAASLTGAAAVLQESSAAVAETPAALTQQLGEIADGIAHITSTLSEERSDADQILRDERAVTDRIIAAELKQVEHNIGEKLREDREALGQDREKTDEDLANERRHTDNAVEHVQALLAEERRSHAHTARSVATRNEFLGIVSHDLRGPLTTISSVAALMDQQAEAGETGQRMRAWAERVRRSVRVMERLIDDLLDFSSFEDGQLRLTAECLDLRPLIHGAVDAFHGTALSNGLSLEADLPAEPVIARHDPHRIHQVMSNVLHNAIKFTERGGSVRIRVARDGTCFRVSVADTGVGIPAGELTGIFERFRQLNPSDRRGLGLGLYISQWIVEAHGGRIWAESQVGNGTTIHFTLPAARGSHA